VYRNSIGAMLGTIAQVFSCIDCCCGSLAEHKLETCTVVVTVSFAFS